ncbi:MAG: AAA family ATPase [Moraxella sp.]|nr:AAA family ATPase [Moraxella sp.]
MKQADALKILKTGCNVFLTGQAGAGKTYLLNQYIKHLHAHHIPVAITASTGIAATHMNGMTIHSWAGIGIKDSFDTTDFKRLLQREAVVERLKNAQVLIIDEVSMLHAKQLDLVDEVLRYVRVSTDSFGGLQVILSGDFFQLPPIGQKDESTKDKFAFMSRAWVSMANANPSQIKVCYLTEQYRQTDSDEQKSFGMGLNEILNEIRNQTVSTKAIHTLNATKTQAVQVNRTRLYTHNYNVDKINQTELDKLTTKAHEFVAMSMGDETLLDTLKKNIRAPEVLSLKVGAKVMFVKNNPTDNVYNGTMGEVVNFYKNTEENNIELPIVKLNDGRQLIVDFDDWSIDDEDGEALVSYSQLPLCLAWAITVHKSQGMTLEAAEIDLSKTFELGQGYVALSRLKSLQGLKLLGLNDKSLLLDEFAQLANRRFLQLSDECSAWVNELSEQDLVRLQEKFITTSSMFAGKASTKADKVSDKPNDKAKSAKPTQANTAPKSTKSSSEQTLELVLAQKTLAQIQEARSLAQGTIIEHISKLLKSGELAVSDVGYLAPDDETLALIKTAYDKLETEGEFADGVKLRPIFDELRETVPYNDIRLALAILEHS